MKAFALVFLALAAVTAFAADAGPPVVPNAPPGPVPPPNAALHEKLFLAKFIRIPFGYIFNTYEGNPKKGKPETFSVQLDTIDLRQPSAFLKFGDMVPNTRFKLEGYQFKQAFNPKTQQPEDVSELTLVNIDTGEKIGLVRGRIAYSSEVMAEFAYEWPKPVQMLRVKKSQEFVLRPQIDDAHHYKLLDVTEKEAVIQLPSGETYTVKPRPLQPVE